MILYIYVYIHVYIFVYKYIYMYIHIYTYIDIHAYMSAGCLCYPQSMSGNFAASENTTSN